MNIQITITGEGTAEEIAVALKQVSNDLEIGNYLDTVREKGVVEFEDSTLLTKLEEVDDDEWWMK
jgi:hypothetical protein